MDKTEKLTKISNGLKCAALSLAQVVSEMSDEPAFQATTVEIKETIGDLVAAKSLVNQEINRLTQ
jgi:hypothetical protein